MKAMIIGAAVSEDVLRAACTRAEIAMHDARAVAGRVWIALPHDVRDGALDRLAHELRATMNVIAVELPAGLRGEGLQATRSTHRGVEDDVSAQAREILHTWLAGGPSTGFDEDVAATDLAWALIDDHSSRGAPRQPNHEEQWASALLARMIAAGTLELHTEHSPVGEIAHVLQFAGRDVEDWLATRLLDKLIGSTAVDEVYVDASELATVARETRPRR